MWFFNYINKKYGKKKLKTEFFPKAYTHLLS